MNAPAVSPADQGQDNVTSDLDCKTWLIVSQHKSDRVVYFTDDPAFDVPTDADWCYVSPHQGRLPQGMTLRNCWGWRYRGFEFIDARKNTARNRAAALLDHNKESLRKLLREKIDVLRKPVAPTCAMGAQLRAAKLAEAREFLAGTANAGQLRMLPTAAAVRDLSLIDMALLIVSRDADTQAVLERTELVREEIAVAIEKARTQDALTLLRSRLMEELAAETVVNDVVKPEHTTPQKMAAAPTEPELQNERLRLRIKLRLKVNDMRRPFVSDYLLDDEVLRHKGRVAQAVIEQGGAVPPDMDALPLISHAAARGQSLTTAAQEVMAEIDDRSRIVLDSERMKDLVLSRLSSANSFADLREVSILIDRLALKPSASVEPLCGRPALVGVAASKAPRSRQV
jgi:hypothetical protein